MTENSRVQRLSTALESINEWMGRGVSWLTLGMVLVQFLVVVLRYLFDLGWIAMQESVTYMHAMVFMVGAAYTLKHQGHVRVDIFYQKQSPRRQALVDLFGVLFLLLPMCGFIGWISWKYVMSSWQVLEGSREAGGLPAVFLLKSLIPLLALLLILQGLAQALQSLLRIAGHAPDAEAADG